MFKFSVSVGVAVAAAQQYCEQSGGLIPPTKKVSDRKRRFLCAQRSHSYFYRTFGPLKQGCSPKGRTKYTSAAVRPQKTEFWGTRSPLELRQICQKIRPSCITVHAATQAVLRAICRFDSTN